MNNSILLQSNATFESHLQERKVLPFLIRRDMCYAAGKSCTSNLHKNIEILHFTRGCGSVLCGESSYDVAAGDVVVVNSYLAHRVDAKETIVYNCLIVYDDFCEENGIDTALTQFDAKITDEKVFSLCKDVIDQYADQSALWQARVRSSVLQLLICLCAEHSHCRSTPITEDSAFQSVIGAIAYMKEHLREKLTVEDIAQQAGFSKFYFLRLFKRITGCTVVQYINLLRCETAKEMLRTGNYSVKEIALLCGFDNLSYFSSVFKKNTGYLPGTYKSQWK
jgi:AraC-like DNA-binding protein